MKTKFRKLIAYILVLMLMSADIAAVAETATNILTLPMELKVIGEEAFYGDQSIGKVVVPDGTTEIRSKAFAGSSITELILPDTLSFIADDAFADCGEISVTVAEGSYAYEWCVGMGLIHTAPQTIESEHPYAANMDQTWEYTGATDTGYINITFSDDTETENRYDFIYIYDSQNNQVGKYSGTELTGKNVEIDGNKFSIRMTSDGSVQKYGFRIVDIQEIKAGPLELVSITASADSVEQGYPISWRIETTGGKRPIHYEYYVTRNGETVSEGTANGSDDIVLYPHDIGDFVIHISIIDANANRLPEVTASYRVIELSETSPESFLYTIINSSTVTINDYIGSDTVVKIPSFINGKKVTSIGRAAFCGCSSLTSIEISAGVTSIGYDAFCGCSSLMSIEIPVGVTSIGSGAFYNCYSLTSIEIPAGVTSIGSSAFYRCSSLTSIEIPAGVTSIGSSTFLGCSSLTSIEIPAGVTSIGYGAFCACSSLTSIEIPAGVTSIGNSAFYGCSSLTSIEIPAGVTSIGNETFSHCSSLMSIEIPAGVTSIGDSAFYACSSLTSIEIPVGVTSIGSFAFYFCYSLTSIEIPAGVTSIGGSAFYYCSSLTSIEIPAGVTRIGDDAFYRCSSLTNIYIPASVTHIESNALSGHNADLVIYGEAGSYAETYAKNNGIKFSTEPYPYAHDDSKPILLGRVISNWGDPLPNVMLKVWKDNDTTGTPEIIYTDANGVWFYEANKLGDSFTITFEKENCTFEENNIQVRASNLMHYVQDVVAVDYYDGYLSNMFDADNTVLSPSLALLSADMMYYAYTISECEAELTKMEFDHIRHYNYDSPTGDHVGFFLAERTFRNLNNGDRERLYAVIVRGTRGKNEWISNFNIGDDGFYLHEGFSSAASEVYQYMLQYISEIEDNDPVSSKKVWLTGHSRGGAVSNILAAICMRSSFADNCIYCYTFACPRTTTDPVEYRFIYNFNNPGDIVTALPMVEFGFHRYGQDFLVMPQTGNTNTAIETETVTGYLSEVCSERRYVNYLCDIIRPYLEEKTTDTPTVGEVFMGIMEMPIDLYSKFKTIYGIFTGDTWLRWVREAAIEEIGEVTGFNAYVRKISVTHDQENYREWLHNMLDESNATCY